MIGKFLLPALGIFLVLGSTACGRIAYIGSDGNVWTINPNGASSTQVTTDATGGYYGIRPPYVIYDYPGGSWPRLAWSPDGGKLVLGCEKQRYRVGASCRLENANVDFRKRVLAYVRSSDRGQGDRTVGVFVTDLAGPPRELHTIPLGENQTDLVPISWSADSQGIYFEECSGETIHMDFACQVKLVRVGTGDVSLLFTIEKGFSASILNPSPNGKYLAWHKSYVEGVGEPRIFNLETQENSCLGKFRGRSSWSPDGTKLAIDDCGYGCGDEALAIFNPEDWSSTPLLQNTKDFDYARPVWSPTGDRIAYTMYDRTDPFKEPLHGVPSLWLVNVDGSSPVLITESPGRGRYSFSADGKYLVHTRDPNDPGSSDPEIWISAVDGSASWRIAEGREPIWQPR